MSTPVLLDNEKDITELSIGPDGRVFVFGTSRQVLGVLESLRPNDPSLSRRLQCVRELEAIAASSEPAMKGSVMT